MTDAQIPPSVLEAEDALVMLAFLDRQWFEEAAQIVASAHFYQGRNRRCWATMESYVTVRDGQWDAVHLCEWAVARGQSKETALADCTAPFRAPLQDSVTAENRRGYALAVFDAWRYREALRLAQRFVAEAYVRPGDAQVEIGKLVQEMSKLRDQSLAVLIEDNVDALKALFAAYADSARAMVVPTGMDVLDEALGGGLVPGSVSVLAARPGLGKTSLAMQIATTIAARGQGVIFVSLEMPRERLLRRELCVRAEIIEREFAARKLTGDDWRRVTAAAHVLGKEPVWIQDRAFGQSHGMNAAQIHQCVTESFRHSHAQAIPCGLVIVDYFQAIAREPGEERKSQHEALTAASKKLLGIARTFKVPVLLLSAMNRDVETRKGEPLLRDLRDCGSLESDADQVFFLHRPKGEEDETEGRKVDVIVRKNRHGSPDGRCTLEMLPSTRFRAADPLLDGRSRHGRIYSDVQSRRAGPDE